MNDGFSILLVARDSTVSAALVLACHDIKTDLVVVDSCDAALELLEKRFFSVLFADFAEPLVGAARLFDWLSTRSGGEILAALVTKDDGAGVTAALQLGAHSLVTSQILSDPTALKARVVDWKNQSELADAIKHFPGAQKSQVEWIGCGSAIRAAAEKTLLSVQSRLTLLVHGARGVGKSFLIKTALSVSNQTDFLDCDTEDFAGSLALAEQNQSWLVIENIDRLSMINQNLLFENMLLARVPILATTSTDLSLLAREGHFRDDLARHFSINEVFLKPLSQRSEDLAELAGLFLKQRFPQGPVRFTSDASSVLLAHDWPGNVHELKTLVMSLPDSPQDEAIGARFLPTKFVHKGFYRAADEDDLADLSYADAKKRALLKFNKQYIAELLNQSGENLTVAAEKAGLDRSNFKKIVRKFFPDRE